MNLWLLGLLGDADSHTIDVLRDANGIWIYCLVFFLILIQEVGVPLPVFPSEVVLLSAGFLASQGKIALVFMGLFATAATLIGNSLLYYVSRRYGRVALDRYGKYVMLRPERIDRIEAWIGRRGTPILMYGPLVPILRAYVPALAGMFGVPYRLYIFVLAGAALVWSYGMLIIGQVLGEHWLDAVRFFRQNIYIGVIACIIAGLATYVYVRWQRASETTRSQHWPENVLPPPPHRLL